MSSIIERPWSEEAFRDYGSEIKYGTSSEQSNQTDSSFSSEGNKSEKMHATAAAGGEDTDTDTDIDMVSVTKGASISPFFMIICDVCGKEMDNTLICPRCERERPGRLIDNECKFCDEFPVGHKSDSCPRKDNPVCYELPSLSDDESDDIALMSDYEPSSP